MVPKKLSAIVSVGGQISPADVAAIAELGFRSIVCHRPDGEGDDQAAFAEITEAASTLDIETWYQPVRPGRVTVDDAHRFGEIIDDAPKPVFAYCRSGRRCTDLWELLQDEPRATTRKVKPAGLSATI